MKQNNKGLKEIKDRIERNKPTYEKNEEEKKEILERLGLQKKMVALQKEETDLVELIEENKKIIDDTYSMPYEKEAAEARIEQLKEKENGLPCVLMQPSEISGLKKTGLFEKK